MCHRHRGLSTYGLNGQRQGDEHPRICPFGGVALFILSAFNGVLKMLILTSILSDTVTRFIFVATAVNTLTY